MKDRIKKWWKSVNLKFKRRHPRLLRCCKKILMQINNLFQETKCIKDSIGQQTAKVLENVGQQTNNVKESIDQHAVKILEGVGQQTKSVEESISQQTAKILASISQQTDTVSQQTQGTIDKIDELMNNGSTEDNKVKAMFDQLAVHRVPHGSHTAPFPNPIFPIHFSDDEDPIDIKNEIEGCSNTSKQKKNISCKCVFFTSLLLILLLPFFYFTSNKFSIDCDKICWQVLVIMFAFLSTIVLVSWMAIRHFNVKLNYDAKEREKRLNYSLQGYFDALEFQRMYHKMEVSVWERQEKLRMDEWQRNNEHNRKLEIMEQERIANLSSVLVELAKTKNTVTLKGPRDNGKTITIERSILSDDCCEELKDIIDNFSAQGDDCCDKIKDVLKCLFGNPIDCEKVKKALKCLFSNNGNDKDYSDIIAKIDSLIAIIQASGSNGVQQVVNFGGNEKSQSVNDSSKQC